MPVSFLVLLKDKVTPQTFRADVLRAASLKYLQIRRRDGTPIHPELIRVDEHGGEIHWRSPDPVPDELELQVTERESAGLEDGKALEVAAVEKGLRKKVTLLSWLTVILPVVGSIITAIITSLGRAK